MKRIFEILSLLALASAISVAQAEKGQKTAADPHLSKGAQLMQEQLFEAAASEFQQALAVDPGNPRARFEFAVCLLQLGRNDEARREFEQLQKQTGESRYITYYLGRLDLLSDAYKPAIQRLGSVAENPPFPDTAFYLGTAYISAGDVPSGIKWLETAAKVQPHDYRVHYRLARAYSTAGREQDASHEYSLYTQYKDEHKSTEKDVRDCSTALHSQPLDAARDVCRRMFDPTNPEKLTLLGQLFGDAAAFTDAVDPLKRAAQLDPGSFEAWHNLGVTYFRLQQYSDARPPLEKAVSLRPDFYGSVVLLGATLYMLGDNNAALPVLERAVRLNPADAQTAAVLQKVRAEKQKQ
jgi:Flp pilus assembly protein TadD